MSIKTCLLRVSLAVLLSSPCAMSQAASLQVAPVLVEVPAPGAASTLKLRNEGNQPLDAQIRIYRWTQADGADVLTPSEDVVASPPLASLKPNMRVFVRAGKDLYDQVEAYQVIWGKILDPK